ncbi:MAG: geranylgeranylglycerol-phosphate geranylgeranyltransferase [Candidatus Methanomethylophilaceae archaeon]|nr:geranylgeranylglycerol-phosphate geranylgeranyltransferase [Candidatus Methanomethylophilaceae archaeon]
MNKYLQLFRIGNAAMGIIGVTVASFMASGTGIAEHWVNLIISAVVVFMFIAGGNSLNDSIDAEIDKTAHPERPVPSGRMTAAEARRVGGVMLAGSVAVSVLTFDLKCIAIVAIACAMMVAYELRLKQRGFVGNLTIAALTGMTFLMGGAVVHNAEGNAVVALMAALVSVGREIAKDIEDMEGDEGRSTLPMRIGPRKAAAVASAFFVAGPALSVMPMVWNSYGPLYYLVVVADAVFVYCAYKVFSDPHKAQSLAKKAMLIALVAFILGVAIPWPS